MSILNKIILNPLTPDQYYTEKTQKKQIYIHHTAGNPDPFSVRKWWLTTPEKVGTSFIIGGKPTKATNWKDGDIHQSFSSDYWAHHLGLTAAHVQIGKPGNKTNLELNKFSIGIELCNWGYLTKTAKGFITYTGVVVPNEEVVTYTTPFKGYTYYHKYTDAQLQNLKELLQFLCNKWNIPTTYYGKEIFDVNVRALRGESGIWTHVSVRPDKFDCHPQLELIDILENL